MIDTAPSGFTLKHAINRYITQTVVWDMGAAAFTRTRRAARDRPTNH